ncbi:alpha-amylase isoform X1 [Ixodes scapularis]|uniref:alpha-amylase isoform X1 n=2 Tax=Ixodes scapularis TaxID=6945 RepID=UPI001A9FCF13|nr:alpha-amylase isoform X1 [Ixodes scapularis]XP_040063030.1 alpha-amylase isoform X1 [Ixodes scapularis]XP_042147948.1 alpha-amylase isoform X1 [Ixodes scapularis]
MARRGLLKAAYAMIFVLVIGSASRSSNKDPHTFEGRDVIVQLFQWRYKDIAEECEEFLGPHGYGGVQTSPVHEHVILFGDEVKRPWYEGYQPVSYKLQNRIGDEREFQDMVRRCNRAGVRIYVDTVINHMTAASGSANGTAGSSYDAEGHYEAVPYSPEDFHTKQQCGSPSGNLENMFDINQVRNCRLVGLIDLDQSRENVRDEQVRFLNKLIGMGVAGFRVDAAKHMWPEDLKVIYGRMNNLSAEFFPAGARPLIYQEVIDVRNGEPVTRDQYTGFGRVTEFLYGVNMGAVFRKQDGRQLKDLRNFTKSWDLMPSGDALSFLSNHDNQRGHGYGGDVVLTFFDARLYKMATALLLALPYGLPRITSSYRWQRNVVDGKDTNDWVGPPADSDWNIKPVVRELNGTCGNGWVCEHRWPEVSNLVELRKVAGEAPVTHWWDNGGHAIAFGRRGRAFVVINNEDRPVESVFQTDLPPGLYCDVVTGGKAQKGCKGRLFRVSAEQTSRILVNSAWDVPMVAIHVEARLSGSSSREASSMVLLCFAVLTTIVKGKLVSL